LHQRSTVALLALALAALVSSAGRRGTSNAPQAQAKVTTHRIAFNRIGPIRTGLFIADADGRNEKSVLPAESLDYNASFSSDGRWIIFTSERAGSADIYRVHPDGSGLERLTSDPAYEDQAALSPDGSTLAFVSTRGSGMADIWLLDLATRGYRNLTNHPSNFRPSWSPDGKWIAFSSDRDTRPGRVSGAGGFTHGGFEFLQSTNLYVISADGSKLRQLTQTGSFAGSPKWSPDGRRIVYYESSARESWESRRRSGPAETSQSQILSMDVEHGDRQQHTSGPGMKVSPQWLSADRVAYVKKQGSDPGLEFTSGEKGARGEFRNPAWCPDATHVVYHRELQGERHWMTPTFSRDPEFDLMLTELFPAYSPTGERVIVSARPPGPWPVYAFEESSLEMMNADGRDRKTIFYEAGKNAFAAKWSPHGDLIVFGLGTFFFRTGPAAQLALIKPDGSAFRTITGGETNNGFPSWSPDGKRIVYRADGKQGRGLMILSIENSEITPLNTGGQYDNFPAWSPRGDVIAFTSYRGGNYDIYTIKPDGTGLRRLTNSSGNDAHCVWSPDGEWIIFSSSRMGFKDEAELTYRIPQPYGELFVMRSDGSDVHQLTDNQWEDATPAWMPESGKR
jgi:Tol biopolymer transport system component